MNWKKYLVALCFSGIMLALAFIQISGSQITWQYDPWADINDDGKIDMKDIAYISRLFGTSGTSINKTQLLLECLKRIENLEARVNALEANYSVTNIKLAPHVIPFNSTRRSDEVSIENSPGFELLPGMSVTLTLNRTSHLIILLSMEAWQEREGNYRIWIGAIVENLDTGWFEWAKGQLYLTPYVYDPPLNDNQIVHYMTYTSHFYQPSLPAGKYQIEARWSCIGKAYAMRRVLTVIALPA